MGMEGEDGLAWGYNGEAEWFLTLLYFSFLSSIIYVCYICSPLHHARTMTEGKGREGVEERKKEIP